MKTTIHYRFALPVLLFATMMIGCDTVDPNTETPPQALPEAAFSLDLDFFEQNQAAGKNNEAFSHFVAAAFRVVVATHVTHTILYYPVTLTAAIQQVEPVMEGDSFVWKADTLVNGQKHGVELRATPRNNAIHWEMYVSGVIEETGLVFEDFLLYEADTGIEVNQGTFQVYLPVEEGSLHVMNGDYDVVGETEHTLSFRIPSEVEDLGGAQAAFHRNGAWHTLDLTAPDGSTHYIEWNEETHEGSLTASDYNNGEKSCWNSALMNTDCAAS